jgi:hypothetical protein
LKSERTLFPFEYHLLPVCGNTDVKETYHSELGEILTGDKVYSTQYDTVLNTSGTFCNMLCKKTINEYDYNLYKWIIIQEYTSYWYADALPAGLNMAYFKGDVNQLYQVNHEKGIPVGEILKKNGEFDVDQDGNFKIKIYNHLTFIISLHKSHSIKIKEDMYSVVDFSIIPYRYL